MLDRRLPPPFVPHIASDTDVKYFDSQFTEQTPNLSYTDELSPGANDLFAGFSYVNPCLLSASLSKSLSKSHPSPEGLINSSPASGILFSCSDDAQFALESPSLSIHSRSNDVC